MTYFVHDPSGFGLAQPLGPASPTSLLEQLTAVSKDALMLPGVGYVGERLNIRPRRLEVRREKNEWHVAQGKDVLASFGASHRHARDALRLLQDSHVTKLCRVGAGNLYVLLSHGRVIRGVPLGVTSQRFDPRKLAIKQIGKSWTVCEGNRPVIVGGEEKIEAELLLAVIRHYGFDHVCLVGHPLRGGLRFFAKSR